MLRDDRPNFCSGSLTGESKADEAEEEVNKASETVEHGVELKDKAKKARAPRMRFNSLMR